MSCVLRHLNREFSGQPRAVAKESPISALFYALGALTFLRFVVKTLFVFSETFILQGTNVSAAVRTFMAVAYGFHHQLEKFGAGKGSWAGEQTRLLCFVILTRWVSHHRRLRWHWAGILDPAGKEGIQRSGCCQERNIPQIRHR